MTTSVNGIEINEVPTKRRYAGEFFNGKRGWADLKGKELATPSGSTSPSRDQFKTGVYGLAFDSNDVLDIDFHLEHRLCKDGVNQKKLHIHIGISSGTVASGNNLIITATLGYFKLYHPGRDMTEIAPITKTFTATPAQLNNAAGNAILVNGDVLIAQTSGGVGLFDCGEKLDNTEIYIPDDNIKASLSITSYPTLSGGLHQKIGIFHVDIHEEVLWGGSPEAEITTLKGWA